MARKQYSTGINGRRSTVHIVAIADAKRKVEMWLSEERPQRKRRGAEMRAGASRT